MIRFYILCCLLFVFSSCSDKQELEKQLYTCLESKIKKRPAGNSEDFFNYLKAMESYSIKANYLKGTTKENYIHFFKDLFEQKVQAKEVIENIDKSVSNDFNFNLAIVYSFYKDCHIGLDITNDKYIYEINEKLSLYDNLESEGFEDYESFIKLINNTDFKSELDRLMMFDLIQIFAYNRSNDSSLE